MDDALPGLALEKLTTQDALDLAILMEEEAHERYLVLAKKVGGRYAGDAADMFRSIASAEVRHAKLLCERRRPSSRRLVARLSPFRPAGIGFHIFLGGRVDQRQHLVLDRLYRGHFGIPLRSVPLGERDPGVTIVVGAG